MPALRIRIDPDNPNPQSLKQVVDCLLNGGIIVYPTDTVYGVGCDTQNQKAFERLCKFKNIKPKEARFSFVCSDLSQLSEYCKQLSNAQFKMLKRAFPGPFTFILKASGKLPKILNNKRKTVGIRIPKSNVATELARMLERPLISTSLKDHDEIVEYTTDPDMIYEMHKDHVDIVVDSGYGNNIASTVIDFSEDEYEVLREGLGIIDDLF